MSEPAGIYGALATAAGRIGALAKTEKNKEQNFMFRSIDAVLAAAKPVFADLGIAVIPQLVEKDYQEVQSSRGTKGWRCTVTMAYTFAHKDGSSVLMSMGGEAVDYGDKSTTKAEQMAYKYALTQVLMIGSGESDADAESHELVASEPSRFDVAAFATREMQMFTKWSEEERRQAWVDAVKAVLEDHQPRDAKEGKQVTEAVQTAYYEAFPPAEGEAPF